MLTDVRAGSGNEVDAGVLGGLQKGLNGQSGRVVEVAALALQDAPVEVKGDGVEAEGLDLLEDVEPERGDGQAVGVELARKEHQALAIDEEGGVVKGDDVLEQLAPPGVVQQGAGPSAEGKAAAALGGEDGEGEDARELHVEVEPRHSQSVTQPMGGKRA